MSCIADSQFEEASLQRGQLCHAQWGRGLQVGCMYRHLDAAW